MVKNGFGWNYLDFIKYLRIFYGNSTIYISLEVYNVNGTIIVIRVINNLNLINE